MIRIGSQAQVGWLGSLLENDFWLHCQRLEQGRSNWPEDTSDQQSLAVTARQLRWLIDGFNWQNAGAHQPFERRAMC